MIEMSASEIWRTIALLGLGTFLIRFSFIGLIGDRAFPNWALRLLRYTPVAVLPGVVAPMLIAGETGPDPLRLGCAALTLLIGVWTRNVLWAILAGLGVFFGLGALT